MANTRDVMGEQACLDALIADELTGFEDDGVKVLANLQASSSLTYLCLPSCTTFNSSCLNGSTHVDTIDALGGNTIPSSCFSGVTNLTHFVLRGTSKTNIMSTNAFGDTNIGKLEGAIYVQPDLVSTFKADNNWNKFVIKPISEYPSTEFSVIDDSWDDIITACGNGTYSTKYNIGDTKSIEIDGALYYMQLVAKDSDVLASDGTTTVPTTWLIYYRIYDSSHVMNSAHTTAGGWADSSMRSWLANSLLPLFPSNVRSAIKEVRKYSGVYENGAIVKNDVTADKLWIPSEHEVNYSTNYEDTGMTFDITLYPNSNTRRVKKPRAGGMVSWWLRTARDASSFSSVGSTGNLGGSGANSNLGVVFGFCI